MGHLLTGPWTFFGVCVCGQARLSYIIVPSLPTCDTDDDRTRNEKMAFLTRPF